MDLSNLKEECLNNGFDLSVNQINKFELYIKLLQEWNNKINLTAITDYNEIIEKHFYDSLIPLFDKDISGKICDVGSGAGFPSIPMKIVDDSLEVVIVEPLKKRCVFLNEVINQLSLKNIKVINQRSEDYVKVARESFDVVIARAVASLSMLSELCIPLVKLDGYFISMKAEKGMQEAKDSENAIKLLGCTLVKNNVHNFNNLTRVNLVYKKIKRTPLKYPRIFSKIKKNPL